LSNETAIYIRINGTEVPRRAARLEDQRRNGTASFVGRRNGIAMYVEKRGDVTWWNGSDSIRTDSKTGDQYTNMHRPGECRS
jgi:hypothetical protein